MKIKLKRHYILDEIIWTLMLIEIMFGNLLGLSNYISLLLLLLIALSCVQDIEKYSLNLLACILAFLSYTILIPVYNFKIHGGAEIKLLYNIFAIITPASMMFYVIKSCAVKKEYTFYKVLSLEPVLNGYAFANIAVSLLQIIVNRSFYTDEIAYWDSISGLFGKYGTPAMSLYISSVIVYDYMVYRYKKRKRSKRHMFIIGVSYLILSLFNDNKAFYLVLAVFILCALILINYENAVKKKTLQCYVKFFGKIGIVFLIVVLGLVILGRISIIKKYYDQIKYIVNLGWRSTNLVGAEGSSERFGMISYALSNRDIIKNGYGIGWLQWKEEFGLGFAHFGISDIGVFLLLGGAIFLIVFIAFLCSSLNVLFKSKLMMFFFVVLMLVLGVYTQLFTEINLMGCTVLYLSVCWSVRMLENNAFEKSIFNGSITNLVGVRISDIGFLTGIK